MKEEIKIPFYAKTALIFISLFAFVYTMDIAQNIIIPIVYAIILAILLNPLVNFLNRKGLNRVIAIFLTVIIVFFLVAIIFYVVFSQASHLSNSFPQMKVKFIDSSADLVNWISGKTNIHESKINAWLKETQSEQLSNIAIKENISKFGHIIVTTVLLPVYLVMVLYYKPLLLDFVHRLFRLHDPIAVEEILANTKKIIQSYLTGLFIEMIIVAILNSIGLLIIGIEYAILFGLLGALLNIIPYLGAIIAASIFMLIALLTKTPIYMLYVLIIVDKLNKTIHN